MDETITDREGKKNKTTPKISNLKDQGKNP